MTDSKKDRAVEALMAKAMLHQIEREYSDDELDAMGGESKMAFYRRKKPVEAVQWFKMGDHPMVARKLDVKWLSYDDDDVCCFCGMPFSEHGLLKPEAWRMVCPGDWIVTDDEGVFKKRDVEFRNYYEEVIEVKGAANEDEFVRQRMKVVNQLCDLILSNVNKKCQQLTGDDTPMMAAMEIERSIRGDFACHSTEWLRGRCISLSANRD